jgi:ATP-dependent DNA helicase RecQ
MSVPTVSDARDLLKRVYGYPAFRGRQEAVIADALAGHDVLAILPTGGGKSVCYQIPALLRPGVGIVVSPLIALMADQVDALKAVGVRAERLDSSMTPHERDAAIEAARVGEMDLLYVSPEGLATGLGSRLAGLKVSLIAIDEAHCVSQWGHDFRPDYRNLHRLKTMFPDVPRMAVTATADGRTRDDIQAQIDLPEARVHVASFDRPNLTLNAEAKQGDRTARVVQLVKARKGRPGIVYACSRRDTEKLAEALGREGINAVAYHAGLEAGARAERQRRFLLEEGMVMCATVAFGMGVDKPDVRFVIHADPPKTIEAYWQEVGRAGRDGEPAEGVALFGPSDMRRLISWTMESDAAEEVKAVQLAKTRQLFAFLNGSACRRAEVRRYFGEADVAPCGDCDNCRKDTGERHDVTRWAQMATAAVKRTGASVGRGRIINHLIGKAVDRLDKDLSRHSTFGVGAEMGVPGWRMVIDELTFSGLLSERGDPNRPTLSLGDLEAVGALWRGELEVHLASDPLARRKRRARGAAGDPVARELSARDLSLFEQLREWRLNEAKAKGVPPYVIFHDKTLAAIAEAKPASAETLREVAGVGEKKAERHGQAVLALVAKAA